MADIKTHFGPEWISVVSVGKGWTNLVNETHDLLSYISPDYSIAQIKQKYGGLRYYADYVPKYDEADPEKMRDIFYAIISNAERRSEHICETCGDFGKDINDNHWYFIGCDKHTTPPKEYYGD